MRRLFSYILTVDDGAAPNPFWGTCTLVICKPRIRSAAQVGDWVVGLGSKNSPLGDVRGSVIYAMEVTRKVTMREYDVYTRTHLPNKIPEASSQDPRRRLGDSIYDFSTRRPAIRTGVHNEGNRVRDLGGKYALLSDHFCYFGDRPEPLPPELRAIANLRQGHRSDKNAPYVEPFVTWLEGLGLEPNRLYGSPPGFSAPCGRGDAGRARCGACWSPRDVLSLQWHWTLVL